MPTGSPASKIVGGREVQATRATGTSVCWTYVCGRWQYVRRGRAARRASQVDPVFQRRHRHHLRVGVQQLQPRAARRPDAEPPQRVARTVRQYMEQSVSRTCSHTCRLMTITMTSMMTNNVGHTHRIIESNKCDETTTEEKCEY